MTFIPPSMTSSSLAGYPKIAYQQQAILEWQANTPFIEMACDFYPMPRRSGRTIQHYGYLQTGANIGTISEGVSPSGIPLPQATSPYFCDEYGDWVGISNVVDLTAIDNGVAATSRLLGYRGALSSNLVASNAFDNVAANDATTRSDLGDNEFVNAQTVKRMEAQLNGGNVPVRSPGAYAAIMSSFMSYDVLSDNTAGGALDVLKRSESGQRLLENGQSAKYTVVRWAGCDITRTSTVPTFANFPSSGKTGYGAYFVGDESMLASEIMGLKVPRNPKFQVNVYPQTQANPSNPLLQIKTIVMYDWFLGIGPRPNTNAPERGFRRVRAEVSAT